MADIKTLLAQADLAFPEEILTKLEKYHALLLEWNEKMDLTSVSGADMASRHFLDSLAPLKKAYLFPEGLRLIDVGTGAGFPGLPLAIARPDLRVTLLEAQNKRCVFLRAVAEELQLSNVEIVNDRAENLGRTEGHREAYDLAIARAVAPLNILCEYLLPFVKAGGRMLCWKGPAVQTEWADGVFAARALGGRAEGIIPMELPGDESGHVLASVLKTEKTLPQYPRKNGIPAKRPLKKDK